MKAQPKASHFINGKYVEDTAGPLLKITYPATQEVIATLHEATPDIISLAVSSALAAQKAWAHTKPVERGRILHRAARLIHEDAEALAVLETLDTGKPLQETRVADWPSGADALEYFASFAQTVTGQTIHLGQDFAYTRREPLGLCLGIGAWNYPSQIACWKAAPALAFGNAMIFKPSEVTPLGALKLAEILTKAGLPNGLFNVIQGRGNIGASLSTHPEIAKVSLTGSVPTGRKVYAAAADGIRHVTMELGGKSPLIIFDDANLEDAVGAAMLANFYSSGQICSNGTRVFVQNGIKKPFLERLKQRAQAIILGDPLDEKTQMGPLINANQLEKVMAYIRGAKDQGADLITGGKTHGDKGLYIKPTVFAGVTDEMTLACEEVFGPVMAVLDFDSEAEVIERANNTIFGLAAGVFTNDITRAHRVIAQLQAGTCWINTYNLTPIEMPFGGVKASGVGRENGHAALEHYTQIKSVYVAMGPFDAPY